MSNKYEKHQKSRYKKFVATLPNGTIVQADTQAKLNAEIVNVDKKVVTTKSVKPQFDPDTGERIN